MHDVHQYKVLNICFIIALFYLFSGSFTKLVSGVVLSLSLSRHALGNLQMPQWPHLVNRGQGSAVQQMQSEFIQQQATYGGSNPIGICFLLIHVFLSR